MLHIMGTSDGMFSMKGLWNWIKSNKWPTTKKWAPILNKFGTFFGFTKEYGSFKLATIYG